MSARVAFNEEFMSSIRQSGVRRFEVLGWALLRSVLYGSQIGWRVLLSDLDISIEDVKPY